MTGLISTLTPFMVPPSNLPVPVRPWYRPPVVVRWVLGGVLAVLLLVLGAGSKPLLPLLTVFWQKVLAATHLSAEADALQHGIHRRVTRQPLLAVATYALLYLALCLLMLRLLVRTRAHWRLVLRLYAGAVALYVVITLGGKLGGEVIWAYRLGRHLLDFVIGPIPVAGLLALFQAGYGPSEGTRKTAAPDA